VLEGFSCGVWLEMEWLSVDSCFLPSGWLSLGSLTLIALILYSLLIDILFGHQSYWSLSPSASSSSTLHNKSSLLLSPSSKQRLITNQSSSSFLADHDDLILYLLQFLNASELLCLSETSHRFSLLSSQNYLWLTLARNSFPQIPQLQPILTSQFRQIHLCYPASALPSAPSTSSLSSSRSLIPQRVYFHFLNRYPQLLISFLLNKPLDIPLFPFPTSQFPSPPPSPLSFEEHVPFENEDRSAVVILHHSVYDLTSFLPHHPGGDAIIREYHGQDATRIFDLAMHSQIARKISVEYCLWKRADFHHPSS
jgi:hypothetical protein